MTETFTREELIARAEKAEAEAKRCVELEGLLKNSRSGEAVMFERAEKAEAEVAALLARLKSTESAMGRAMELGSEWRKEAADLRAAYIAKTEQLQELLRHADQRIVFERTGCRHGFQEEVEAALGARSAGGSAAGSGGSAPRTCETCEYNQREEFEYTCVSCVNGTGGGHQNYWTPKPIPSTTDKGEKP